MDWLDAAGYGFARQVLQRGTAAVYLIAFLSAVAQFRPLLGEHGLLPVPAYLRRPAARKSPTIFRWHYSDRMLAALACAGALLAAALLAGLPQEGPDWAPMLAFLLLWGGYLSIVNVGQVFYGFGWESLLLEAGFLCAFLGSRHTAAPVTVIWLARWLVFRLEFGAGLIKIRGDSCWRDLTALYYHHETQPMPNPASWWFHHLPKPLHRLEVLGNHITQLVVPFFLFAPQPLASLAAAVIIVTQLWLVLSGNFAWLNTLTIILAFSAVDDGAAHAVLAAVPAQNGYTATPLWFAVLVLAVSALLVALSYWPARNLLARRQLMNASFNRWHLCNAYGAFGTITRSRYEIIVEGTLDEDDEARWEEYEFKGKPGDPRRLPRQFAPYHLRLDWLMWFLGLGARGDNWFLPLLHRLLNADRATLKLLRRDPFGGLPPARVRARVFRYRYSSWAELRSTGQWWVRQPAGTYVHPVSLADFEA
ncbi:lipase maturation factor family protein [Paenarthrobacter sp. DKR-5]|uniref:lipase maturation factor family protein n=1 Tax=Paenarthrobacter sp. DKR-5 TaxID=2835535 RepID=UPI001BDC7596|nr:lipase maturation factor family protein [Paenarthrobacter sp. DKR-5]MBT1002970.1 lipase maturation factor family protein [Paenarthrobacter sp. DKR-5]